MKMYTKKHIQKLIYCTALCMLFIAFYLVYRLLAHTLGCLFSLLLTLAIIWLLVNKVTHRFIFPGSLSFWRNYFQAKLSSDMAGTVL